MKVMTKTKTARKKAAAGPRLLTRPGALAACALSLAVVCGAGRAGAQGDIMGGVGVFAVAPRKERTLRQSSARVERQPGTWGGGAAGASAGGGGVAAPFKTGSGAGHVAGLDAGATWRNTTSPWL